MAHRASVPAVLGALLVVACGGPPVDPASGEEIYFPQHGVADSGPTALFLGTLRLENGCLLVESDEGGEENLILWPPGWSVESSPDGVRVRHASGSGAGVGRHVRVGGGQTSQSSAEEEISEPIPDRCLRGVYWFMTEMSETAPTDSE